MASTKITYVTGTAEIRRRDPSQDPHMAMSQPEQHFVTEPSTPLQVAYVDGKCTCCPYGYHIDLDFLNFCSDLETGSTLRNLKRIQRTKRNLRKSMEIMLHEQEGIKADPNSAPPDVVRSTEAERLMHMVNYEQSATVNILRQIDTSVRSDMASFEGRATWQNKDTPENIRMPHLHDGPSYKNPPVVLLSRADSSSSLSSSSTISSEVVLLHQAELIQQKQSVQSSKTVSKVVEQPVLEMATAEMRHYSTISSAQLADTTARVNQSDADLSTGRKMKQNFSTEVSATYRTPDLDSPKEPPDVSETSVQSLREAMAASLQRIKALEEQVKTIPILQVRISVLKEEKRLLNLQLKAVRSSTGPLTSTVGVGDDCVDFTEEKNEPMQSHRLFSLPSSTSIATSTPRKDLVTKSPPPTLPKPVKTASVAVGNHSVIEPYNLQPHLSTGYTIRENEAAFGIYSKTVFEQERSTFNRSQEHLLNSTFQQTASYDIPSKESYTSNILQAPQESNQSNFTVNQMQKSSSEVMTRTVGVGDANVFEDSKLHVHEKELRTVIIGQNTTVAKRNVGIECRPQTRDVGVLFICDEEKPATRTIGVNVNYDTSGIFTSLDFKGERELRVALQGVLHRSVKSVGTSCSMKEITTEHSTMTDLNAGVSIGCGDEEHRVDVEVRPAVVRKSVAASCKPDVSHRYVSTEVDWALDASTNTYQVDSFDKGLMTDKVKQVFASTNTGPVFNRPASNQTEQHVFISLDQIRHIASNTENITRYSTGVSTDIITTHNACVNTFEKVSELFNGARNKESVDNKMSKEFVQKTIETDRKALSEVRIESIEEVREDKDTKVREGKDTKMREGKDTNTFAASGTSNTTVQEQVSHEHSDHESSFLGKSEYTKKLLNEAYNKESVDNRVSKEFIQKNIETDRTTSSKVRKESTEEMREGKDTKVREGKDTKVREGKDTNISASSGTSNGTVQEQVSHEHSDHESSFLGKSEYTKKSSRYDYGNTHYTSLEISSRSAPANQSHINHKKNIILGQEDLNNNASILEKALPDNTDEKFSETVVEHFILTKDGKKLISEEKITTSSAGTNRSFKQYANTDDLTVETDTSSTQRLDSHGRTTDGSQTGSWNRTQSSSYNSDKTNEKNLADNSSHPNNDDLIVEADTSSNQRLGSQGRTTDGSQTGSWNRTQSSSYNFDKTNEKNLADNSNISLVRNQYQVAENLANVSTIVDSSALSKNSLSNFQSQKSEQNAYYQESTLQFSQKSEPSSGGVYKMRRAGSVEDFMPNDIRKYMSINPTASTDTALDRDLIHTLSNESVNSTASSRAVVSVDTNERKTHKTVSMKRISKSGGLSPLPEIKTFQSSSPADSGDVNKEVVEEIFVKSEASFCGEQGETSGQHKPEALSSATTVTDMSRFLTDEGQMWSSVSSHGKDERSFDSLATCGTQISTETVRLEANESSELSDGMHTRESFERNPVLKSIMKHTTETQCASTKKAITFAETVTGGTGSSSDEDHNSSDAESTDSFDEGSYDGQQVEVTYYSKEEGSLSQVSPEMQVLDQNIRETYELSNEVKNACAIVGTYLTDSTSIQTKQLNASQELIQQEWFQLSSHKLSSAHRVEDFLTSVNEISNRLLEYIINMADANGNTAIHYCISHCNFDITSLLLDSKVCDTNRRNKAGYTPIMLAGLATIQDQQQYDLIKRLLSLGDVNARATETQQTALMLAASHGRKEMVKLLIEEGADVNLQDEDGSTALMCACEHGHLEVVNILLMHPGIDVNLTDCENCTAINIAMEAGNKDIGVVLYKHLNFSKVSSPGSQRKDKKSQFFHAK